MAGTFTARARPSNATIGGPSSTRMPATRSPALPGSSSIRSRSTAPVRPPARTVAAALDAIVLGLPGVAVSQQSSALELDFKVGTGFDFTVAAAFTARLVTELERVPLPDGTLLNVNVPGTAPKGVEVARLGK